MSGATPRAVDCLDAEQGAAARRPSSTVAERPAGRVGQPASVDLVTVEVEQLAINRTEPGLVAGLRRDLRDDVVGMHRHDPAAARNDQRDRGRRHASSTTIGTATAGTKLCRQRARPSPLPHHRHRPRRRARRWTAQCRPPPFEILWLLGSPVRSTSRVPRRSPTRASISSSSDGLLALSEDDDRGPPLTLVGDHDSDTIENTRGDQPRISVWPCSITGLRPRRSASIRCSNPVEMMPISALAMKMPDSVTIECHDSDRPLHVAGERARSPARAACSARSPRAKPVRVAAVVHAGDREHQARDERRTRASRRAAGR